MAPIATNEARKHQSVLLALRREQYDAPQPLRARCQTTHDYCWRNGVKCARHLATKLFFDLLQPKAIVRVCEQTQNWPFTIAIMRLYSFAKLQFAVISGAHLPTLAHSIGGSESLSVYRLYWWMGGKNGDAVNRFCARMKEIRML